MQNHYGFQESPEKKVQLWEGANIVETHLDQPRWFDGAYAMDQVDIPPYHKPQFFHPTFHLDRVNIDPEFKRHTEAATSVKPDQNDIGTTAKPSSLSRMLKYGAAAAGLVAGGFLLSRTLPKPQFNVIKLGTGSQVAEYKPPKIERPATPFENYQFSSVGQTLGLSEDTGSETTQNDVNFWKRKKPQILM
jgi:hypothetical protein